MDPKIIFCIEKGINDTTYYHLGFQEVAITGVGVGVGGEVMPPLTFTLSTVGATTDGAGVTCSFTGTVTFPSPGFGVVVVFGGSGGLSLLISSTTPAVTFVT